MKSWAACFLWLAVATTAGCGSSTTEPGRTEDTAPVIVALGDSLTAGQGLSPDQAYPALIQQRARAAGYRHRVLNAGASGDTSADALRRLDAALVPEATVLIVALGANDAARAVPVASMRASLSTIIERARARGMRVLLCGLVIPPIHDAGYSTDFNGVFPELAARYDVALMPSVLAGVVGNPALNLSDGLHPNAAGHRVIADGMWPYLEPLLR